MAENEEVISFQWHFRTTGDVVHFSETEISVFAASYKEALKKIKSLDLPYLDTKQNIQEGLKLLGVHEGGIDDGVIYEFDSPDEN